MKGSVFMGKNSEPRAEMTKRVKNVKLEIILLNVAIILIGVLMVVFPEQSQTIICRVVGILLCAWGLFLMISYFARSKLEVLGSFALVQGVALAGFGVYILLKPEFLAAVLTIVLAIILLAGGAMKLQYAMDFMRLKLTAWWTELIGAVCMIVLGIVAIADPFKAATTLMIFLGISLLLDGVWDLVSILVLSTKLKAFRKNVNAVMNEVTTDNNPVV